MMKRLVWILLVVVTLPATAQYFPSQTWHEGELTLLDGDRLRGKIKYNLEADVVQLNVNNTIQTYSARKLLFFEIYDQEYGRYRQFYALPYDDRGNGNYEVPRLFEVLHENALTLLCREEITQENIPQYGGFYGNQMGTRPRLTFNYFFLDRQGEIVRYSQKKGDLYDILSRHSDELQQYIKKNRLKHDRQGDLVRITAYYNSLLDS